MNLIPVPTGLHIEISKLLQSLDYETSLVLVKLVVIHLLQPLLHADEEGIDPRFQILWSSLTLNKNTIPIRGMPPTDTSENDVSKLLLGPQLIKSGLVRDLLKEHGLCARQEVSAVADIQPVLNAVVDVRGILESFVIDVVGAWWE